VILARSTLNDGFTVVQQETDKIAKLHSDFGDQLVHEVKDKIEAYFKDTSKQKKAVSIPHQLSAWDGRDIDQNHS